MLNQQEMDILRELAEEYAQIASLPEQNARRAMWLKLNSLNMERPMVLIDQIPWGGVGRRRIFDAAGQGSLLERSGERIAPDDL